VEETMHIPKLEKGKGSLQERRPLASYWVKKIGGAFTVQDIELSSLENPSSFDSLRKVIVKCELWGGEVESIAHLSSQHVNGKPLKTYTRNEIMSLEAFKSINNKA
jgi:hypothetical protein